MNKEDLKNNLNKKLTLFFGTNNINDANVVKDEIYKSVFSLNYDQSSLKLVINSKEVWSHDIGNYLTILSSGNVPSHVRHDAFLAMKGIINLIDFSEDI